MRRFRSLGPIIHLATLIASHISKVGSAESDKYPSDESGNKHLGVNIQKESQVVLEHSLPAALSVEAL
jgi:hypothetical protein